MKTQPFISRVIADGRVTIPKNLREEYGIGEGDFVEVQLIRKVNTKNKVEGA